ncbi:MAG: hypothetical protein HY821_02765 [Acidobacteria bacterium]|nr:hypothetical protein [Acidobacteriota bacterium]
MLSPPPLTFEVLLSRLMGFASERIRNGDMTERAMARLVDLSQPHLHNVLKGKKGITLAAADGMLQGLALSLLELVEAEELGQALLDIRGRPQARRHLPLLEGRLGPFDAFPDWRCVREWLALQARILEKCYKPALIECAPDPENLQFPAAAYALVEQEESARLMLSGEHWFAIRWRGAGFVRQVRWDDGGLHVLGQTPVGEPLLPRHIDLNGGSVLQVVRARVLWMGHDPRLADPFDGPAGVYL